MTTNTDNVRVTLSGAIYVAPVGSTLPTDSTTGVDAAFTDAGLISDKGVTESLNDDKVDVRSWDGSVARTYFKSSTATFQFELLEHNAVTQGLYYKASLTGFNSGPGSVDIGQAVPDPRALVIDTLDGDVHIRYVIPKGEVTTRGDVTHNKDGATVYPVTITAYQASDGVAATKYFDVLEGLPAD